MRKKCFLGRICSLGKIRNEIIMSFYFLLFVLFFVSCGRGWYADQIDNISLTPFSKELISTFLNDSVTIAHTQPFDDEVTLLCFKEDSLFFVVVWLNESKMYKHLCYESIMGPVPYLGKTIYSDHSIRVFGEPFDFILSVKDVAPRPGRCRIEYSEYDPVEWTICFRQDTSFCKDKTVLWLMDKDVSPIESLVSRFF